MDIRDATRPDRAWLDIVLAGVCDAVLTTDTGGHVVFLNRAAEELTGWPMAEAVGQQVTRVFQVAGENIPKLNSCMQSGGGAEA